MRKLFSRRKRFDALIAPSGGFVVPTWSDQAFDHLSGREAEASARIDKRVTPAGLWSPSSSDSWSLTREFVELAEGIDSLPSLKSKLKKCTGCGSTEETGTRCSYCRGLV